MGMKWWFIYRSFVVIFNIYLVIELAFYVSLSLSVDSQLM